MKEVYIEKKDNIIKLYVIEDYKIVEKIEENLLKPITEGNIYIAKVQNVLKGMNSAFINIGDNKNSFISLNDIIMKKDINKKNESKTSINKVIKPGEPILVQVMKEKNYKKGSRVTKNISLTGKYFVLCPFTDFVTVSSKIKDDDKRNELKNFYLNLVKDEFGGIVRTNALYANDDELIEDFNCLIQKWNDIKNYSIENRYPIKIYDVGGILNKYFISNLEKNFDNIIVNSEELKNELISKSLVLKKEIIIDDNFLEKFDYQKQIDKISNRKIWLKCGGFITIDKTEALTAIDVNSGKYTGKDNFENTIYKVNEEAAIEILKQIRLRDIGGIIIIDFIDMHIDNNKEKIIELIKNEALKDNSRIQIEGFTKLNLLELTRKTIYGNSEGK